MDKEWAFLSPLTREKEIQATLRWRQSRSPTPLPSCIEPVISACQFLFFVKCKVQENVRPGFLFGICVMQAFSLHRQGSAPRRAIADLNAVDRIGTPLLSNDP